MQLKLTGAAHATFIDIAVLLRQAADIGIVTPDQIAPVVGTIDGQRATAVVRTYVSAYFDRHLRRRHTGLLDGPSQRYPEIKFTP